MRSRELGSIQAWNFCPASFHASPPVPLYLRGMQSEPGAQMAEDIDVEDGEEPSDFDGDYQQAIRESWEFASIAQVHVDAVHRIHL